MKKLLPVPKKILDPTGNSKPFAGFNINMSDVINTGRDCCKEIISMKLWNYKELENNYGLERDAYINLKLIDNLDGEDSGYPELFLKQGYILTVERELITIRFQENQGLVFALSTLKQFLEKCDDKYMLQLCRIVDWPSVEIRSVSNTFAWYAGYGRLGFDMQLWGYDEWVEYLNICSDFKINQFIMCMYGYWPFEFEAYPETVLKDYPVKVWNEESSSWIVVHYMHPNVSEEFLSKLFDYGHKLGMKFFAYIGLNSYNGGYSSINKDKRMKLPEGGKFVNDFDTLCLSQPDTVEYLKSSIRKIVSLGFDGIDFEESEEAWWFCSCDRCKERYLSAASSPAEAKHMANYELLKILYDVIREKNPACIVGLRAWREPPLEKDQEYIKKMVLSIPDDVVLFWAPGLYCPEGEFEKWAEAFGKDRIWARDTESNAVSSCFGRLIRIFRSNGLRCEEETNHQYIEEDIRQHIGSVKLGVKGINGYMFEWYGFFMHLFAHANYGWGSLMEPDDFYKYSLQAVFGDELADDILFILKNMFTIHESQMGIFPTEFPFARNKVEARDIPEIEKAITNHYIIMSKLERVKAVIEEDEKLKVYLPHFKKLTAANLRNRVIYDLSLASIGYDNATTPEDRRRYLLEMSKHNERNFDIVKANYFDVNPVAETGTKSCMIPYHELKRVINNELFPDKTDAQPIYLGVEALGWLWL